MADFVHREADYTIRIIAYIAWKNEITKVKELCDKLCVNRPKECRLNLICNITHFFSNLYMEVTDGSIKGTEIS